MKTKNSVLLSEELHVISSFSFTDVLIFMDFSEISRQKKLLIRMPSGIRSFSVPFKIYTIVECTQDLTKRYSQMLY